MPTDPVVQTTTPVPPATSTQPVSEDAIKAHPLYKDLETRYAAAHKEIDGKKTKKELEAEIARLKIMAGEESAPAPVAAPTGNIDAKKIQEEVEWNIANKENIQSAGQPYYEYLGKGYSRDDALTLALARKPDGGLAILENLRAQQSSSPGGSVDRTPINIPAGLEDVPQSYVEEFKKKYPGLSDAKIAEYVKTARHTANIGQGLRK